jgi:cytochrome c-type biogenesis protein
MSLGSYLGLFTAGLLTFASPCVLPMLPLYLSVLGGAHGSALEGAPARRGLRLAGIGFALGLSLVFVILGAGASVLAASLAAHRRALLFGAGAVMILLGAKLLGLVPMSRLDREARPLLARVPGSGGLLGGFLFGAAFGVGWTPCVGPVLGAALTYAASTSASPWVAGAQLGVYALGLSAPLIAAAFAAPTVLAWTRRLRAHTPLLQRGTGALMIFAGGILAADRLDLVMPVAAADAPAAASAPGAAPAPCEVPGATSCAAPDSVEGAAIGEAPTGMPRLIEFTSHHCPVCAKMDPLLRQIERACASPAGTVLRVDVDDEGGRALMARYGVRLLPTFISVDSEGNEVERIVGEQTRERLALALGEVRSSACPAL